MAFTALPIITFIVYAATFVGFAVSFGIPYWLNSSMARIHMGLWTVCFQNPYTSGSICASITDAVAFYKATQAMETIGLIFGICGVVSSFGSTFVRKENVFLKQVAVSSAFLSALFILIGVVVFGVEKDIKIKSAYDFHAGFALAAVTGGGFILSGILTMFVMKQMDSSGFGNRGNAEYGAIQTNS